MKQILLDNAYESWKNAIICHDRIENGFSTLQYQKGFVSSLHNAVELFLKQIMLNNNDYSIATVKNVKDESDAQLQLDYFKATDLNTFFDNLSLDKLNKFYSIEFNQLIEKIYKLLDIDDSLKNDFTNALKVLQKLRNNEMHFYINETGYLSEDNFCHLHNFMIIFYNAIGSKKLFPRASIKFDEPNKYIFYAQEKVMEFNRTRIASFSFLTALKDNEITQKLKITLKNAFEDEYVCCKNDSYGLALCICLHNEEYRQQFDDLFIILRLMEKYNLFFIERKMIKVPEVLGIEEYPEEKYVINY